MCESVKLYSGGVDGAKKKYKSFCFVHQIVGGG